MQVLKIRELVTRSASQMIEGRGQFRLFTVAIVVAFALLLKIPLHAAAQSPDAIPARPVVCLDCTNETSIHTAGDNSASIRMYAGPRNDTENIMDEAFEVAPAAVDSPVIGMYAGPRGDTENIMDEKFEVAAAAPGTVLLQERTFAPELVRTGLPDGSRASGIYSIDGGYGLAGPVYADLVTTLSGNIRN